MEPLEKTMALIFRLKRIGRLAIAPIKGFFKAPWNPPKGSHPLPECTMFWPHMRAVARKDTLIFFEPFTYAIREFREERTRSQ
jgi:hypothetical protein